MEDLNSKSTDELIEIIESLNDQISEKNQEIEDLSMEVEEVNSEVTVYEESSVDEEAVAEAAFNAGYDANENGELCMRSWLNYKIEARI